MAHSDVTVNPEKLFERPRNPFYLAFYATFHRHKTPATVPVLRFIIKYVTKIGNSNILNLNS